MRSATAAMFVLTAAAVCASQWVDAHAQSTNASASALAPQPIKLIVLIAVDQFRADYVTTYARAWTGGLREIVTKGASFTEAAYPYGVTKTCAGHSSMGTGTLPSTHGMIDNTWFDPATRNFVNCTDDAAARPLMFGGGTGQERHSAVRLMAPTFAETLQRQSSGRSQIVSLSVKARSAIGMVGHGGPNTTIVWSEDRAGSWSTSSALTRQPSADVAAYVRAHPVTLASFQTWDRLRPAADYLFADRAPGEPAATGVFPHLFDQGIRLTRTSPDVLDTWLTTPFTDTFVTGLAMHLVDRQRLGQGRAVDMLAISFSALDSVGHTYGPRSHEVQDTLMRLDQRLSELLALLDARVGREHYVVAFTSDHGVSTMPEQVFPAPAEPRAGAPVEGRTTVQAIGTAIETVLDKQLGRGSYVEAVAGAYVYFRPGVLDRLRASPPLAEAVEKAALGARGVGKVYWSADVAARTPTDDPILVAMRRSYFSGRSGDLAVVLKPNWVTSTGANHGTPYADDARVPLVLLGAGIVPGEHASPASPLDIAPTFAALTGVRMAGTDGRVLREALVAGTR
jgi:predicted AlkP superfamily pyrophosphatase or phosphodiesterase